MSMHRIAVPSRTALDVSVELHTAKDAIGMASIQHGICHSAEGFHDLAHELNNQGLDVALIDLRTDTAGKIRRNFISMKSYVNAYIEARHAIEEETGNKVEVSMSHSMGGWIDRESKKRDPHLQGPSVYMAPVPTLGTLPMILRIMRDRLDIFLRSLPPQNVHNVMQHEDDIRYLLGDAGSTEDVIKTIQAQIHHSSSLTYLRMLFGHTATPSTEPILLAESKTDRLCPTHSNDNLQKIYSNLSVVQIPGGHDFFVQYPRLTADAIMEFWRNMIQAPLSQKTLLEL
jgi:alpha-beta hydrolase superfamily lysophospholipase